MVQRPTGGTDRCVLDGLGGRPVRIPPDPLACPDYRSTGHGKLQGRVGVPVLGVQALGPAAAAVGGGRGEAASGQGVHPAEDRGRGRSSLRLPPRPGTEGLTLEARDLVNSDIRSSTKQVYGPKYRVYADYCMEHGEDPLTAPPTTVVNFLAYIRRHRTWRGRPANSYSSVAGFRSAINKFHPGWNNQPVSKHPLVKAVVHAGETCSFHILQIGLPKETENMWLPQREVNLF